MNKKIAYTLLVTSMILTGCGNENDSSSSTNDETSSDLSNVELDSSESSSTSNNYVKIDDVSKYFETYSSEEDYNFTFEYQCDLIANRNYQGGWKTSYILDGYNMLLTYESDGIHYVDYYIYDEETDQMIYYLDNGSGKYKYLDMDNEFYFSYVSYIDYFELVGIDFEEDMLFDLDNNICVPKDDLAKDSIGRTIFGDNPNEYWHKIEISYKDGYISAINAISIYQEVTYYYTITLSNHGYASGSVIVPDNAEEYINPNQPYYKGRETYTGNALTTKQADALTMFSSEETMNYTIDSVWTIVYNGEIKEDSHIDFKLLAENGNYEYSYADSSYPTLMHYFYLVSTGSTYPLCYLDEDFDGNFTVTSYGMDDYESYVSQIYLDRILLFAINPDDFIYDENKGYITAKDAQTEQKYCDQLFYFADTYGGLRIYLKETDDGSLVFDKIETSVYIVQSDNSVYSFVKTYTFTNVNETKISYPDGIL